MSSEPFSMRPALSTNTSLSSALLQEESSQPQQALSGEVYKAFPLDDVSRLRRPYGASLSHQSDSEVQCKLLAEEHLAQSSIVSNSSNPPEEDNSDVRYRARCQLFLKLALALVATMITMIYFLWGPPSLALRSSLPIVSSGAVVLGNPASPPLESPASYRQHFLDVQSTSATDQHLNFRS